jgi:hypothetical protein
MAMIELSDNITATLSDNGLLPRWGVGSIKTLLLDPDEVDALRALLSPSGDAERYRRALAAIAQGTGGAQQVAPARWAGRVHRGVRRLRGRGRT